MRVRRTGCLRIDSKVQRRRKKKAAPKNIFGSVSQPAQKPRKTTTSKNNPSRPRSQIAPPPSVPGAKPKKISPPEPRMIEPTSQSEEISTQLEETTPPQQENVVDPAPVETVEADPEVKEEDIIQEQILGESTRKDIGLDKKNDQSPEERIVEEGHGKSLKARQIIQDSMLKASLAVEEAKTQKKIQQEAPSTVEVPKKPQKKFKSKTSSYQPANRAKRLDRSRHMEYKYEMRGLLSDIGIAEEHRSNLLATIWARGERQTTKEAKEFLEEKLSEGIIDEDQMTSLEKIVEGYTVRR